MNYKALEQCKLEITPIQAIAIDRISKIPPGETIEQIHDFICDLDTQEADGF